MLLSHLRLRTCLLRYSTIKCITEAKNYKPIQAGTQPVEPETFPPPSGRKQFTLIS